jgi:DMSO/TMAO reductase YedYZ heme-binding membrane subunit
MQLLNNPNVKALTITFFVVLAFLLFYTGYNKETKTLDFAIVLKVISFSDFNFSIREINKLSALAGLTILSLAFLPGPLSKIWSNVFGKYLVLRKPLGIIGFILILLHSYLSFVYYYKSDLYNALFNNPKQLAFIAASISFLIFVLMALTSTKEAVQKMGYQRWKMLQRTGYFALFLAIIHFVVVETKPNIGFDVRPFAYLALIISIATLILRIYVQFFVKVERKSYEEHFSQIK